VTTNKYTIQFSFLQPVNIIGQKTNDYLLMPSNIGRCRIAVRGAELTTPINI